MKLFDLHADIGYAVWKRKKAGCKNILSFFYTDQWKKGDIKAVCMASYFDGHQNWEQMMEMVELLVEEIAVCPQVTLVTNAKDIHLEDDQIYAILSIEGMCGIHDHVEDRLDWLYEKGVRLGSLCWNEKNALACGVKGGKGGLTELGIRAVQHMEQIGMRIDVSHANEETFWDIYAHTTGCLIASHSNAAALCPNPRNLTQRQIEAIAQRNGLIGIVAAAPFVHPIRSNQNFVHLIRHLEWMCSNAGFDHVGFGFDFMQYYDGVLDDVKGLENPEQAKNLSLWLQEHALYKKTAFENAARILSF